MESPDKSAILTPPVGKKPRINGATVFGVRPGAPLRYTIAATGERPMMFDVAGLPRGAKIDSTTGVISGKIEETGTYKVTLHAFNSLGTATRDLKIVVGKQIALTPPMGWNSWNCWGPHIDQAKILAAAQAMVSTRLIQHGWSFINIDDGWQGTRDSTGTLQPDPERFTNMATLCDEIHAMGLKPGIYSSPWAKTFAGRTGGSSGEPQLPPRDEKAGWYIGSQTYEAQDARQWAAWGMNYLKYDWGPMDLPSGQRMRAALDACGRDILFNPTNSAPDEDFAAWAEMSECYFLWRRPKTGDNDIKDSWASVSSIGFRMSDWADLVRPGHWNDPDMLVVGRVGWDKEQHPCGLTADEQYTHISLWSLLAAPLLLGCDLTQLDPFTLNLLTNDEVLAINQDPLGQAARKMGAHDQTEIWSRPLEDGSLAVGFFNRGESQTTVTADWRSLGIEGTQTIRDLWRQKDLGTSKGEFGSQLPPHGVMLLRLSRA
jgi:alpha-galactosidase